jgi:hypothetical protein
MLMPRYTQTVGHVGRIATVLLIVLLAGGPALASVCEAMCVPPDATTETTATEGSSPDRAHHHQPAAQAGDTQQTAAGHNHHQSGDDAAASSRGSHVSRFLGRHCCTELAPPRHSLTASRVDTNLGSDAVASSTVMRAMPVRQAAWPTHGPPPGGLSPARTPLVLRI